MTGKIKGYLNFKQYSAFGDSWPSCLCEFDPSSKHLTVSLKKGGEVLLSAQVQAAKPVPPKFNRRPNRFDVVTEADGLAAFTAPSDAELTQWLQAFAGTLLSSLASSQSNGSSTASVPPPLPPATAVATASRNSTTSLDDDPPASPVSPSASAHETSTGGPSATAISAMVEASAVLPPSTASEPTLSPATVVVGSAESKSALYERVADSFAAQKLGHFLLAIHDCDASPSTLQAFRDLYDAVLLGPQVGMKKVHVTKYRRAVSSLT